MALTRNNDTVLTMENGSDKQCIERQKSYPIRGQHRASPRLIDHHRRQTELPAFELHVPQKNNNKYDKNIQNIALQERTLMNKYCKIPIKYFEY